MQEKKLPNSLISVYNLGALLFGNKKKRNASFL